MKKSLTLGLLVLTSQIALAQIIEDIKPGGPRLPPQPVPASCPVPERHRETDYGSHHLVGIDGRSGRAGVNGVDGRSAQDISIVANGSALSFNLRGTDGSDASDGYDGEQPSCAYRDPYINYNIQQASGGAGGDAGRPGRGGSGGDATIYFTDNKQLKAIYIDATPGIAGESARSGRGARGCACYTLSWQTHSSKTVTRVVGDQKLSCIEPVEITHSCRSGSDGRDGSSLSSSNGSIGSVTLIKSAQPLPANSTSASLELTQAASTVVTLVRNIFENRSGANLLLANGSIVDSTYSAYVRTAVLPAQLVWKARSPISDFAGARVSYSLANDGLSASISTSAWTVGRSEIVNGQQLFIVERALLEKDAARLSAVISGNGKNTILTITDEAAVTDLIDRADISLNMDSKGVFSHDRYDGPVPANNIRVEGNKYIINLYDLWVLKNSQKQADGDLKKGKVVKVDLSVTRSMGSRSASFSLNFDKYKLTDSIAIKD